MGFDPISLVAESIGTLMTGGAGAATLADGSIVSGVTSAAAASAAEAGATAQLIGGASSLVGGLAAGAAQSKANQAAEYNAKAAENEKSQVAQQGIQEEQKSRLQTAAVIGAQRAGYGAAGLDSNSGTAATVQAQTAQAGEYDALTIHANSLAKQQALEEQARGYRASEVNPLLPATTSMLASSASMMNSSAMRKYYQYMQG